METGGGITVQNSLTLQTFANDEKLLMDPDEVLYIKVDGERVWVSLKTVGISIIEAKNAEDVTKWGRDSGKLKETQ